jgi:hypothetical protein
VGVLEENLKSFLNLNSAAGSVSILSAPYWLDLSSVSSSHYHNRLTSHYSFTFSLALKMSRSSAGGVLFL